MKNSETSGNNTGIDVGEPAPDFELIDTHDNPVRLSDFQGKQNILLVMNRSFVCPFCRRHMAQLRHDYKEFVNRNTEVIILGPNNVEAFKRNWKMEEMPMIGLADPGSKVADMYQQEVNLLKLGRLPAMLIIDKQGIIRFIHYSKSMADIPGNKIVLSWIDKINLT
jgi:peroxiredoxin